VRSQSDPNGPEVLWHLQDLAAILWLLLACKSLLAQQLPNQTQGINLFLQAFQFGFFATKYFHGVLHIGRAAGMQPLVNKTVRSRGGEENVT
jgi:hypothetical protein